MTPERHEFHRKVRIAFLVILVVLNSVLLWSIWTKHQESVTPDERIAAVVTTPVPTVQLQSLTPIQPPSGDRKYPQGDALEPTLPRYGYYRAMGKSGLNTGIPLPTVFGSKALRVVIVESSCTSGCPENWDSERESDVIAQNQQAFNWWHDAIQAKTGVDYTYLFESEKRFVPWEPITQEHGEVNWTNQLAEELVDEFDTTVDMATWSVLDKVRYFNQLNAEHLGVDHAFTVFVVDSKVDPDGMFSDGWFAFAYLGGPYTILTYDNDGWGPENMHQVATHELGHLMFLMLDQYPPTVCGTLKGYLKFGPWSWQTQNSDATAGAGCRIPPQPGIMAIAANSYQQYLVSESSWAQGGWSDVGRMVEGVLELIPDNYPDVLLPDITWVDNGFEISNIEGVVNPLPVSNTPQFDPPSIGQVYLIVDGQRRSFFLKRTTPSTVHTKVTTIGAASVANARNITVCMEIDQMPTYCEMIRDQAPKVFTIYLPYVER